jgi:hypothetical protein
VLMPMDLNALLLSHRGDNSFVLGQSVFGCRNRASYLETWSRANAIPPPFGVPWYGGLRSDRIA